MKKIVIPILLFVLGCQSKKEIPDAYGNFEALEVFVSAEANGQIKTFTSKEGDILKENQVVGFIDTTQQYLGLMQMQAKKMALQAKIKGVKANIQVLNTEKKNLEVELNRIKNLYENEAATQAQLDNIQGKKDVLEARIEAAKTELQAIYAEMESMNAQLEMLQEQLKNSYIVNPIQGTVLEKYAESGEITTLGKPLYKIADLSHLEFRAYLTGAQLSSVKLGQQVELRVDGLDQELETIPGTITWIASEAEFTPKIIQTKEERVNLVYAMKVRVNNNGMLKIGMPGEVIF